MVHLQPMFALILRILLDVRFATHLGASLAGEPELGPVLVQVARRESQLDPFIGQHEIDAHHSAGLRPQGCSGGGWSTRGAHGQMAVYALQYLPGVFRCQPWLIDIAVVSAWTGARRAAGWRCRQVARCRSWMGAAA